MSTKSKRTTTSSATRTRSSVTSAVHVDTDDHQSFDDSHSNVTSPTSPTRVSRYQEKEHLSHLNDRLAVYIDKVRQLETENARLTVQIRDVEVIEKREKSNLRAAYEDELTQIRNALDATAQQKAKLQIDADKARAEYDDLRARVVQLEKDLKSSETARLNSDSLVQDLQARVNTAENRRKHAEDDAKKLRSDNDALEKQLQAARRQLEEETLFRVDLENRLQSMKEELDFNKKLYDKELEETRRKRQVEMTSVSRELETEYQAKLQEQLKQMRSHFDAKIAINRREIEDLYNAKLNESNEHAQRCSAMANEARDELAMIRSRYNELEKSAAEHDHVIEALHKQIKDLESQLQFVREDYAHRLHAADEDINRLNGEINRMINEYQDLMDTKIQLGVELQAYQKLLESEESRLHLTPATSPQSHEQQHVSFSDSGRRGAKRKRVLHESDERYGYQQDSQLFQTDAGEEGDIEVAEHETNGRYIRIHNKGDEEVSIGGWQLKSAAPGREVSYKFHSRQALKPGKTITVWSSNSEQTHAPPADLVMKNQTWPAGDSIRSFLIDSDGTEVAWRESKREFNMPSHTGRSETENDPDQRCSLM